MSVRSSSCIASLGRDALKVPDFFVRSTCSGCIASLGRDALKVQEITDKWHDVARCIASLGRDALKGFVV